MKYLLHPGIIVRDIIDEKGKFHRRVRTYISALDLVKFYKLEDKEYELYDGRKHRDSKDVIHIKPPRDWFAVQDKALGAPTRGNKKGFFGE